MQAGAAHQQLDLVVPDRHAPAERELGMDPASAVDPVALGVDLSDQVGQHRVPDGALGRRPTALLVEAGLGDSEDSAGDLHRPVLSGDHFDRRVPPFGLASSFRRSTARWAIASSVSSSAILFFAAASSAFSAVVRPGSRPQSMRSCRRQL